QGAGLAIEDHDAGTFGREVLVPPSQQGPKHRPEVAAALRENIFVSRRPLAILAALEQAAFDQGIQAPGQHIGRDIEALLELVEPRQSVKGIPEDQDAPPLTHTLKAARDGTLHISEAFTLHDGPPLVTIVMIVT